MKHSILLILLISGGLLACQNQTTKPQQKSRIDINPTTQWHSLLASGYAGTRPEYLSDYLLLAKDSRQRDQTRQLLKAQLQHDPTGEKELLYIANLMQVLELEPGWAMETREMLWARQARRNDVAYELVMFYSQYPRQPGKDKLLTLVRQADKRLAASQRIWLWAMLRLPDALKTETTAAELKSVCQNIAATTPAFSYTQPSNLQLCRRLQLMTFRQQGEAGWPELFAAIKGDLNSKRLLDSDVAPLMTTLISSSSGTPMSQQAIGLASLAGERNPQAELMSAGLLLGQSGEETETSRIEKRLVVLHQQGEKQAAYLLGRLYLEGRRTIADPHKAESWLKQSTGLPESSYLLGRLYLSGILDGEPRVQEGVDLLVMAAREGYRKADVVLADAFLHAPGIKTNPVYSWVFASLALEQQPDSLREQQRLAGLKLDPRQQQQASALLAQERNSRGLRTPARLSQAELVSTGTKENDETQLVSNF